MANTPNIRFKGFVDDWEQRKLGDEAIEILAGGDIDKNKAVENGRYPIYANALTDDGIVGYYDDYYRVKAPAVTVTGRGEVGHAQARMFDFTPVVRLLAIRSNHDCYFLENAINNHKVVVESTGVPQLTVPQLSLYDICFPISIEEEVKVGKYFHCLDRLITLHQRKCDEVKQLKKFMLQKMFPKSGELVPEIRFAGFTDDWEQRKLIDISEIVTGTTPPTKDKDNYDGGKLFVSPADIQGNRYVDETITTLTPKGFGLGRKLRPGSSLFVSIGSTIGKVAQIRDFATTNQQINAVISNNNMDDDFTFTLLEQQSESIRKMSAQQAVPIINKTTFGDIEIFCPSKEEQKHIGCFFKELDHLITLHQRKCDELKEVKRFMLQNMFPQKG